MSKFVYIITKDPKEYCELVSGVFAQALTALSFDHECDMFFMDNGSRLIEKGYVEGLTSDAYPPLAELIGHYTDMNGKLYGCHPAMKARSIEKDNCIEEMERYVNASRLIESADEAKAVFTF